MPQGERERMDLDTTTQCPPQLKDVEDMLVLKYPKAKLGSSNLYQANVAGVTAVTTQEIGTSRLSNMLRPGNMKARLMSLELRAY